MSSTVEKIKERLNIVDIVSSYIKLDKAGISYKAKCPFHNEKTASFFVSPERGSFYCFGCGAKGDMFTFVEQFEGVDFKGALKILADRAGVPIEYGFGGKRDDSEKLFDIIESATEFYQEELTKNPEATKYLLDRGLTEKTIFDWRLGFAPLEWKRVLLHLEKKGFSLADIEKAGLIKPSEKNPADRYDRFRDRIMFPIFDPAGRSIAFSGRILHDDGKAAKYINSPETPLFDKSKTLYGLHEAKRAIRLSDYSLLVEGQMDLLMCHQAGIKNAVASSGTALTEKHLEALKRLSNRLMIVYDGDTAGINAAERGFKLALSLGFDVKIAALPSGIDPADMLKTDVEGFKASLRGAKHIIVFELDSLLAQKLDNRALGQKIRAKVLPYVAALESAIERSHFISLISSESSIPEDALREEVEKLSRTVGQEYAPKPAQSASEERVVMHRHDAVARKVSAIIFWLESGQTPTVPTLSAADIEKKVIAILGDEGYRALRLKHEADRDSLIFEAEASYGEALSLQDSLGELFRTLAEDTLKNKFVIAMAALKQAERDGDTKQAAVLLAECQDLSKALRDLS